MSTDQLFKAEDEWKLTKYLMPPPGVRVEAVPLGGSRPVRLTLKDGVSYAKQVAWMDRNFPVWRYT